MAASPLLLWLACGLGAGAVGVLRHAWALPQRSVGLNAAGWGLIIVSIVVGWHHGGAWGVSVAALTTTAAAFVALTIAGLSSPAGRASPSRRRAGMLPQNGEPRRIGRRVGTFLLVIPGGFLAALALAIAARELALRLGAWEADANVIAFFVVPLGWALLTTALLMLDRRRNQLITLLACGITCTPFILASLAS